MGDPRRSVHAVAGPRLRRFALLAIADASAWAVAIPTAVLLRLDFDLSAIDGGAVVAAVLLTAVVQVAVGYWQGLYRGRWQLGSFEELRAMAVAVLLSAVALLVAESALELIPLSVALSAGFVAITGMCVLRYLWRLSVEKAGRPSDEAAPTLVFGAGNGGEQVITAMLRNAEGRYRPVVIADDDPAKRHLRIRNVPVEGTRHDIARLAERHGCTHLLIAIPSGDAQVIREVSRIGVDAGLSVRTLPAVAELLDHPLSLADIRPVQPRDLLGRREIDTDVAAISSYVRRRRVLVTGAGGSIGSELCRQVKLFEPEALVMLDRDESALHAVQLSIDGRGQLDDPNVVVADIRDHARMAEVFDLHRPEVVFHAAALKHLPLLEMHPGEGVKTNVVGTAALLELAVAHGIDVFVNISTDKAANPGSVLGYTKRITEMLTAEAATRAGGRFLSVRFGNVLGSRGSVLTAFRAQIAAGGPVTVTHPEVTRFFMTVEEAVQLVVQAGAIGADGEVLVLDMGEPVRIVDVARQLVDQASEDIEIVFTGLRPNEKLHEELFDPDEVGVVRDHELVRHVVSAVVSPRVVDELEAHPVAGLKEALARACLVPGDVPAVPAPAD